MRIKYVDGFRGLALLGMVLLHIYDALARTSIYTDAPFFIPQINAPLFNPPALFSFVSGIGTYLLTQKLLGSNTKKETSRKAISLYAKYILLSLPFTIIMWGITTFTEWNEAIQGIGLCAITLTLILTYMKPKNYELILSIPIISASRELLQKINNPFPYDGISIFGIISNATYRGFFSVMNLLPIMIGGVLFYKATRKYSNKKLVIVSAALTTISLLMHISGIAIDYYGKTLNFTIYAVSTSCLTFSLLKILYSNDGVIQGALAKAGRASLKIYILHHLLVIKPIQMLAADMLPEWASILIAIPLTYVIYYITTKIKLRLIFKENIIRNEA